MASATRDSSKSGSKLSKVLAHGELGTPSAVAPSPPWVTFLPWLLQDIAQLAASSINRTDFPPTMHVVFVPYVWQLYFAVVQP